MAPPKEPILSANALEVLQARYLRRGGDGEIDEAPGALFARVAKAVAEGEKPYGTPGAAGDWEELFLDAMVRLEFLPNSPTLMNAGTPVGQLSACFVLPVEDSIRGIFTSLMHTAIIHQTGGGTGFNFSRVRPKGDQVASTRGVASGALSFMRIFNAATDEMRQGGRRRGANMGILNADHPEIEDFIAVKQTAGVMRNFNLSVGASDAFMEAVKKSDAWQLKNPRTGEVTSTVEAGALFHTICEAAWAEGDPGMVFLDAMEEVNPTPGVGRLEATNPCGEVPLLPYESCNLGSINLARCLKKEGSGSVIDWEKLGYLIRLGVRFLDNVVEVNRYPVPDLDRMARANRKIGLGVMGLAETFIRLGVAYDSPAAVETAGAIAKFIRETADTASAELAKERGAFPNWKDSVFVRDNRQRRNATVLSIAPTGTISIIANTTSGIEPLFGVAYTRSNVLSGRTIPEVSPVFIELMEKRELDWRPLIAEILRTGSVQGVKGAPDDVQRLFRCALDIDPMDHLQMQAAFQRHVDNAVSKTVNLPFEADAESVASIYRAAHKMRLKGITVFRYASKEEQVLSLGAKPHDEQFDLAYLSNCDPGACGA